MLVFFSGRRLKPGSATEAELVDKYIPLVRSVVARLAMTLPPHVDGEDLYSAGLGGLLSAIRQYDPMAGTAQYFLGETYYTRGRYIEAAAAFAEGYKRNPKSPKAAEELLKLGMSLARANQKQNACVALSQLDHDFPNPGAAVRERANSEKKRLGC